MSRIRVLHRPLLSLLLAALLPMFGCAASDETGDEFDQIRIAGEESGAALVQQLPEEEANKIFAQIAVGIIMALNESEVALSAPVVVRAQSASVREYADRMVRAHLTATAELEQLVQGQDLQPMESSISLIVRVESTSTALELVTLPTEDVDLWYMEKQIYAHAKTRVLLSLLATRVQNEEFRTFLNELITEVDEHLFEAIDIARRLAREPQPQPNPAP